MKEFKTGNVAFPYNVQFGESGTGNKFSDGDVYTSSMTVGDGEFSIRAIWTRQSSEVVFFMDQLPLSSTYYGQGQMNINTNSRNIFDGAKPDWLMGKTGTWDDIYGSALFMGWADHVSPVNFITPALFCLSISNDTGAWVAVNMMIEPYVDRCPSSWQSFNGGRLPCLAPAVGYRNQSFDL